MNPKESGPQLIRPGHNCRQVAEASRLAVLIDGQAYFAALREAIKAARRSIWILAWDIDSRIELVREDPADGLPVALGDLLAATLKRNRHLEVRILEWDFAMIYAAEREWRPLFSKRPWPRHRRLRFRFDADHPIGASHHQKIVVVDDRVAFVGGMDPSKCRWDSTLHLAEDPRRVDPSGDLYPPFHDVQVALEGPAAEALGEIVRERWRRATGERVGRRSGDPGEPWPAGLRPDMRDVEVAIARTEPAHGGRAEVREVEQLTLDAIGQAERSIYIENQFLTSASVCDALEERLRHADGPDIVLVLPYKKTSWLEEYSMGLLRSSCLRRLRSADRFDRLSVYYPHVPGLDEQVMNVHAKVLITDERFLRIGSSNLTNRSMGFDTECDVAIEAGERADIGEAIRRLQHRMLAHMLDLDQAQVARSLERHGRLGAAVDELRSTEHRSLAPLDGLVDERLEGALPESAAFDPESPLAPEALIAEIVGAEEPSSHRRLVFAGLFLVTLAALAAVWRWTPLAEWIRPERLADWLLVLAETRGAALLIPLLFAVASLVGIPVLALIVAVSLVFDGWQALVYAWLGAIAGAVLSYALGNVLGREVVRRLAGERINRLSRRLAKHGLLAVAALRIVPVAPFAVVNLVMGASHIRFRDYLLGTMIGMLPGIAAITLFVDRILAAVREATPSSWLTAAVAGLALAALLFVVRRLVGRHVDPSDEKP